MYIFEKKKDIKIEISKNPSREVPKFTKSCVLNIRGPNIVICEKTQDFTIKGGGSFDKSAITSKMKKHINRINGKNLKNCLQRYAST